MSYSSMEFIDDGNIGHTLGVVVEKQKLYAKIG